MQTAILRLTIFRSKSCERQADRSHPMIRLVRITKRLMLFLLLGINHVPVQAAVSPAELEDFRLGRAVLDISQLPTRSVRVGAREYKVDPRGYRVFDCRQINETLLKQWSTPIKAGELTILHTFQPGPGIEAWRQAVALAHRQVNKLPDYPTVCRYEIEYEDKVRVPIAVRYGESIR
ncbi:MAG: hypothetical protein D6820_12830, partial [Lentisphaerae bacterium]